MKRILKSNKQKILMFTLFAILAVNSSWQFGIFEVKEFSSTTEEKDDSVTNRFEICEKEQDTILKIRCFSHECTTNDPTDKEKSSCYISKIKPAFNNAIRKNCKPDRGGDDTQFYSCDDISDLIEDVRSDFSEIDKVERDLKKYEKIIANQKIGSEISSISSLFRAAQSIAPYNPTMATQMLSMAYGRINYSKMILNAESNLLCGNYNDIMRSSYSSYPYDGNYSQISNQYRDYIDCYTGFTLTNLQRIENLISDPYGQNHPIHALHNPNGSINISSPYQQQQPYYPPPHHVFRSTPQPPPLATPGINGDVYSSTSLPYQGQQQVFVQ